MPSHFKPSRDSEYYEIHTLIFHFMLKGAREVLAVNHYDNPKRSGGCLNHLTDNYTIDNLRIFLHYDFIAK